MKPTKQKHPSGYIPPTAEIYRGRGRSMNKWYYRLRTRNGEIIAGSEAYANKWNAKRAARRFTSDLVDLSLTTLSRGRRAS